MRKALVIGIDDYPTAPLAGCVNDAIQFASLIETNGDGSPNFSVRCLTTAEGTVTTALMHDAVNELFSGEADTALFFFVGHGLINQQTNAGFIVSNSTLAQTDTAAITIKCTGAATTTDDIVQEGMIVELL